jgi:hypothetical protein
MTLTAAARTSAESAAFDAVSIAPSISGMQQLGLRVAHGRTWY